MLVIAGIIEGFITPLEIIDEDLKLIIAAFTGILLMLYFSVPYLTKNKFVLYLNIFIYHIEF